MQIKQSIPPPPPTSQAKKEAPKQPTFGHKTGTVLETDKGQFKQLLDQFMRQK